MKLYTSSWHLILYKCWLALQSFIILLPIRFGFVPWFQIDILLHLCYHAKREVLLHTSFIDKIAKLIRFEIPHNTRYEIEIKSPNCQYPVWIVSVKDLSHTSFDIQSINFKRQVIPNTQVINKGSLLKISLNSLSTRVVLAFFDSLLVIGRP